MEIGLISGDESLHAPALRYLSSYLRRNGYDVRMLFMKKLSIAGEHIDSLPAEFHSYSEQQLERTSKWARGLDLIGLSCISLNSRRTHQLAEHLKSLDIPLVWGGAHATVAPEECLDSVDIVCRGEGEKAMLDLASRIEAGKSITGIPNLWIWDGKSVRKNPVGPLLEDLDDLGGHDYDLSRQNLLDGESIRIIEEEDLGGLLYLNTIRGCPYDCSYCWWSMHHRLYDGKGGRVRKRSPESAGREIEDLTKRFRSVRHINFMNEDDFLFTISEVKTISRGLQKAGVTSTLQTSPRTLSKEKLEAYLKGGMTHLGMGIQSGSDRMLKIYNRPMLSEETLRAFNLLKKYSDKVKIYFQLMNNCALEQKEDILETFELLKNIEYPHTLCVYNLIYIPGTPLYQRAVTERIIGQEDKHKLEKHGHDTWGHMQNTKTCCSPYLTYLLSWCRGKGTKWRRGLIPHALLPLLLSKPTISFFDDHPRVLDRIDRILKYLQGGFKSLEEMSIREIS